MTNGDQLHLLLAVSDDSLAHDIAQKVRARFEVINVQIEVVDDGKRAANEFRGKRHPIVIAEQHLPGLTGLELADEVRKIDGSAAIFVLGSDVTVPGIEAFTLPIVNWTDFLNRLQNAIPDDMKAKYGLFERNTQMFEKLVEYAKKYRVQVTPEVLGQPLLCIPLYFDEDQAQLTPMEQVGPTPRASERVIFKGLNIQQRRTALCAELIVLGLLLLATGVAFHFAKDDPDNSIFSLKGFCIALTLFSFAGFFVGHALERFVLSKDIEIGK